MVDGGDDREGQRQYRDFVLGGITKDMSRAFWEGVRGQAVLGSDEFVGWVFDHLLAKRKVGKKEFPRFGELVKGPETIGEIAREVARVFEVPEAKLSRVRSGHRVARSLLMELGRLCLARKKSLSEIGQDLGRVSVSALSQSGLGLVVRMGKDQHLRPEVRKAEESLEGGRRGRVNSGGLTPFLRRGFPEGPRHD